LLRRWGADHRGKRSEKTVEKKKTGFTLNSLEKKG